MNALNSKLDSIRQAVLPFEYLLNFFREKDVATLQKRLGFSKSLSRLPGPATSLISAIDECLDLLQISDHERVRKGLPGIVAGIGDFGDWLDQILTETTVEKDFITRLFPMKM